jgi:sarcosine oxidase subunit beta
MDKTADVIIIGGGVIGLSTAYHLTRRNVKPLIIEKNYITSGSTGRCIGGIRQQYATETTIKVAMESVDFFNRAEEELGVDVEWYAGGYLFLAFTEAEESTFKKAIEVQRRYGLDVSFISADDCFRIVPMMHAPGLRGGAYCPSDGQADPFKVCHGYARRIKENGGRIITGSEVVEINTKGDGVQSITTNKGNKYYAEVIVNAGGPWAKDVSKLMKLDVPIEPERHESMITERVAHLWDPMLVDYRPDGSYFYQRVSGQIIGCYTPDPNVPGIRTDGSLEFFLEMPRRMCNLVPALSQVSVLRHWAGCYSMTPDGNPIVDETDIEGFFVAGGMCGHGFMFSPAIGSHLANYIVDKDWGLPWDEFKLTRKFKGKEALR